MKPLVNVPDSWRRFCILHKRDQNDKYMKNNILSIIRNGLEIENFAGGKLVLPDILQILYGNNQ
jgi:hypothetical protein